VGNEIAGTLADVIFGGESGYTVSAIVRYARGSKLKQAFEGGRLQFAKLAGGVRLSALKECQVLLEYPTVTPMVVFGALG
jgi:hypothetical protein